MKKTTLRHSLNNVFYGGIATSAMDTLATGPILIAYALMFGAGNIAVGFLGSIGFVGNLMHLLSAWLIEQGKTPRQISVLFSGVSRPFYLIAALLAFWAGSPWALIALLVCFSATYMVGSVAGGAWLPWMKALVPERLMGRFFSHRFKWMMIAKVVCYGLGAGLIWYFENYQADKTIFAYSILLGTAFIIGIYGVYTLTQVENLPVSYQKSDSFLKKTLHTLKNKPFCKLLIFLGVLNFAVNFATPFFTVFMLKSLGVSTSAVVLLTLISQMTHAFTVKRWGRLADKKNCQTILQKSIPLFMLTITLFMACSWLPEISLFSLPVFAQNYLQSVLPAQLAENLLSATSLTLIGLVLILTNVVLGIGQSAITLGINNISLLFIPPKDASIYLSVNSVFKSFTSAVAGIFAGIYLNGLDAVCSSSMIGWTMFWITGILLCVISLVNLKYIRRIEND